MSWKKYIVGEFSIKRLLKSTLFFFGSLYTFFSVFLYFQAESVIFQPQESSYQESLQYIKIRSGEDVLFARYLKNPEAKYTVLFSHGNAEDIGELSLFFQEIYNQGLSVLAYDYSGYGMSTGQPSEDKAYENIDSVYQYLIDDEVSANHIIIFGRSVGSGPSTDLAIRKDCAALILQSPFTSASRVLTKYRLFFKEYFNNVAKIEQLKSPLLLIHGQKDRIIAPWHGEVLYERTKAPKEIYRVEDAGHNDVAYIAGEDYWLAISNFVSSL